MSKLYVYSIAPIDLWPGWFEESDYLKSAALIDTSFVDEYRALKEEAMEAALDAGWEGDFRQGPFVAGIPSANGEPRVMIAWKQESNGTTFVVSPVELTHL